MHREFLTEGVQGIGLAKEVNGRWFLPFCARPRIGQSGKTHQPLVQQPGHEPVLPCKRFQFRDLDILGNLAWHYNPRSEATLVMTSASMMGLLRM